MFVTLFVTRSLQTKNKRELVMQSRVLSSLQCIFVLMQMMMVNKEKKHQRTFFVFLFVFCRYLMNEIQDSDPYIMLHIKSTQNV